MALSLYDRITIGAQAMVPLVRLLRGELGRERADALVRKAMREVGRAIGARAAAQGPATGASLARGIEAYAEGGALEYTVLERDEATLAFDVTRCAYAEFMRKIGAEDLGGLLICDLDFAIAEAMGAELTRGKTCMKGDGVCDFRYRCGVTAD